MRTSIWLTISLILASLFFVAVIGAFAPFGPLIAQALTRIVTHALGLS